MEVAYILRLVLIVKETFWQMMLSNFDYGWLSMSYKVVRESRLHKTMINDSIIWKITAGECFWCGRWCKPEHAVNDSRAPKGHFDVLRAFNYSRAAEIADLPLCPYASLIPFTDVRYAADDFVQEVLGEKYIAVHHRSQNGFTPKPLLDKCVSLSQQSPQRWHFESQFPDFAAEHCNGTRFETVRAIARFNGLQDDIPIFLASDRFYKARYKETIQHASVRTFDAKYFDFHFPPRMLEELKAKGITDFNTMCDNSTGCHWSNSDLLFDMFKKSDLGDMQVSAVIEDRVKAVIAKQGAFYLLVDMWIMTQAELLLPAYVSTVGETICVWRRAFFSADKYRLFPPFENCLGHLGA
eukprot:gene24037-29171_t